MAKFFRKRAADAREPGVLGQAPFGGTAFTAATVLAIALVVSVIGSFVTYINAHAAFKRQTGVVNARQQLQDALRSQLDEETGLRGFLASGQHSFLQPYYEAAPRFDLDVNAIESFARDAHLTDGLPLIFDLRRTHQLWQQQIAQPLLSAPTQPSEIERLGRGRILMDRMRSDVTQLTALLNRESAAAADAVNKLLLRAATLTAALMLLFGTSAIVADVIRTRTQAALERERIVGDTLQRAFLSGWDILPYIRVGTAYVSAARHAAVGGDLFDLHRIDDNRCLLVVADVSGKGLDAAVETAFVKYSIRTLADDYPDPAVILRKFNHAFLRSVKEEGSFITVFVGILDRRDSSLLYTSAGHAPIYLRRGTQVEQLAVTGPVIGLRDTDVFPAVHQSLTKDDLLILATDGLTEARDTAGMMLDDEGAMRIIREGPRQPQELADFIVASVTRLSGGRIADDLALLVIEVGITSGVRAAATPEQAVAVTP